jgi:hypothetical protein
MSFNQIMLVELKMKKVILIAISLIVGFSSNTFAKTVKINYSGSPVSKNVQLAKDDVVMINTSVKVGTKVMINVSPVGNCDINSFTFNSSLENVTPGRKGGFADQMYTGANPGWVSYTYTGPNNITAKFELK